MVEYEKLSDEDESALEKWKRIQSETRKKLSELFSK